MGLTVTMLNHPFGEDFIFFSRREAEQKGGCGLSKCSMYGISTYIYHKFMINVGKYSIHGAYGLGIKVSECLINGNQWLIRP